MTTAAAIFGGLIAAEPAPAASEPATVSDGALFAALLGAPAAPAPVSSKDAPLPGAEDRETADGDLLAALAEAATLLTPPASAAPPTPTPPATGTLPTAAQPALPADPQMQRPAGPALLPPALRAAPAKIDAHPHPQASASAQNQPALFALDAHGLPAQGIGLAAAAQAPATTAPGDAGAMSLRSAAALAASRLLQLTSETGKRASADGAVNPTPATPATLAAETARLELALPPGSGETVAQAFAEGMAARLDWMAEQKIGQAEISLHPAELGSIEVQLQIEGNEVRAEFSASTAEARQLLESSLPRLRELFQAQGLALAHADVGQHHAQGRHGAGASSTAGNETPAATSNEPAVVRRPLAQHGHGLSEYA